MANENTTISSGMVFRGSIEADHAVVVEGRLEGNLVVRGRVQIQDKAEVKANISARDIEIFGSVQGNILNAESVSLHPSARLAGDVQTAEIQIQRGAKHNGNTVMR
ncbi:MAG: hypothetical protein LDLANPLL_02107 [Turneriella sp.]|nr:hypothetical protein [Turneriella sp.]